MVELLEAVFLGVVQGLTEFLPVSSSGDLLLSQYFLGMDQERFGLSFDAAIHTGTLLAVVFLFRGDFLAMARALLGSLPHPDFADAEVRTAYLILLATVPGALFWTCESMIYVHDVDRFSVHNIYYNTSL